MNKYLEELFDQQAKLEEKIKSVQEEIKTHENLSLTERLAVALHSKYCRGNHTDWCGWFYGYNKRTGHDWKEYAHADYLHRAELFVAGCRRLNIECIEELVEILP